jgi:hypothetical protein
MRDQNRVYRSIAQVRAASVSKPDLPDQVRAGLRQGVRAAQRALDHGDTVLAVALLVSELEKLRSA